jgi:hypothetical protein
MKCIRCKRRPWKFAGIQCLEPPEPIPREQIPGWPWIQPHGSVPLGRGAWKGTRSFQTESQTSVRGGTAPGMEIGLTGGLLREGEQHQILSGPVVGLL